MSTPPPDLRRPTWRPTRLFLLLLLVFGGAATGVGVFAQRSARAAAEARAAEDAAAAGRSEAVAAGTVGRQLRYAARMSLAAAALRRADYAEVADHLRDTLPGPDEPDDRGWEWHALYRAACAESRVVPLPGTGSDYHIGPGVVLRYDRPTGRAERFDPLTGRLLTAHVAPPEFAGEVSPGVVGGRWLTLWGPDAVRVWDAELGRPVGRAAARVWSLGATTAVDIAAGGRLVCLAPGAACDGSPCTPRGACEVWDLTTGTRTAALEPPDGSGAPHAVVRISPDGRWVGLAADRGRYVVWDAGTGRVVWHRPPPAEPVERWVGLADGPLGDGVVFTADGSRFAVRTAAGDGVEVYDPTGPAAVRTATRTIPGFGRLVGGVAFSPDGGRLAAGDTVGAVVVFDLAGGDPPRVFPAAGRSIRGVGFRADGAGVYAHSDSTVVGWEWAADPVRRYGRAAGLVRNRRGASLSPAGDRLLVFGTRGQPPVPGIDLVDLATGAARPVEGDAALGPVEAYTAVWSADGRRVAFEVDGGTPADGLAVPVPPTAAGAAVAAGLAGVRPPARVVVIDAATGRPVGGVPLPGDILYRGWEFSPCGRFVAVRRTGPGWRTVRVLELAGGRVAAEPADQTGLATGAFSPDGGRYALVRSPSPHLDEADEPGGRAEVYDLLGGGPPATAAFRGPIRGRLSYGPDGRAFAVQVGRRDPAPDGAYPVVVYEVGPDGPRAVAELAAGRGHDLSEFSPDGRWVAVQDRRNGFAVFAAGPWRKAFAARGGPPDRLAAVRFTPDGRRVVGLFADDARGEVRVWDTATGAEVFAAGCGAGLGRSAGQSPAFDGRRLVVVRDLGSVEVGVFDGTPVPDAEARRRLGLPPP